MPSRLRCQGGRGPRNQRSARARATLCALTTRPITGVFNNGRQQRAAANRTANSKGRSQTRLNIAPRQKKVKRVRSPLPRPDLKVKGRRREQKAAGHKNPGPRRMQRPDPCNKLTAVRNNTAKLKLPRPGKGLTLCKGSHTGSGPILQASKEPQATEPKGTPKGEGSLKKTASAGGPQPSHWPQSEAPP